MNSEERKEMKKLKEEVKDLEERNESLDLELDATEHVLERICQNPDSETIAKLLVRGEISTEQHSRLLILQIDKKSKKERKELQLEMQKEVNKQCKRYAREMQKRLGSN